MSTRTRQIGLGLRSTGMLLSAAEFDALPEAAFDRRFRYEVINGVLVVSPPPGPGQRGPNDILGHWLWNYRDNHPQGRVLDATLPEQTIQVGAQRRCADRAIWAGLGRLPDPEGDVPTIVVEFVSARRRDAVRDHEQKRAEYLDAGVAEYWVIDRFRRVLVVNRPGAEPVTVQVDQEYQTALLPGFVLPLGRLLTIADEWKKKPPRRPPAQAEGAE